MPATVLDSFALIAYFRGERAGIPVKELLQEVSRAGTSVHMTEVNYAEVKYMIVRKDGPQAWQRAARILRTLPVEFHPADRELAEVAAEVKSVGSFSLADAFTIALTKRQKAELITGDPEFRAIEHEVRICWLPQS